LAVTAADSHDVPTPEASRGRRVETLTADRALIKAGGVLPSIYVEALGAQ